MAGEAVNFVSRESQCFPRRSRGKHLRFVIWQNKTEANFEKRAEIPEATPGHL